jgi:nucleotide-binding universal stress UspA family protein
MKAGELAASIGKLYSLPVLLVRAYPEPIETGSVSYDGMIEKNLQETRLQEARNACEKRADELEELTGLRPETEVSVGEAARVVLEAAGDGTTLIVMGSRGFGAVRRMALGSVSTKVLHAAEGPVLIFPHG